MQLPNLSRELRSTQVIVRFCLRIGILVTFAAFASIGFGRSLAALLWMLIILCAVIGAVKREPPLGTALNHWDEAIAYALFENGGHAETIIELSREIELEMDKLAFSATGTRRVV